MARSRIKLTAPETDALRRRMVFALGESGKSQADVARHIGIGIGNLGRLLRGDRLAGVTAVTLKRFAAATGTTVSELLGETGQSREKLDSLEQRLVAIEGGYMQIPGKR